jgi:transcriptional regulator with PAS, ATPase and Fis domain
MYRLRVVPIFLPPLRAREGDVWLLTQRFIEERNLRGERKIERVSPGARALIERHPFPGNVRELKNIVEYAFVVGEGPVLVEADLPPELTGAGDAPEDEAPRANVPPVLPAASPEAARILRVLERAGGSRDRAASMLGISRVTLWRRMTALGLVPPRD